MSSELVSMEHHRVSTPTLVDLVITEPQSGTVMIEQLNVSDGSITPPVDTFSTLSSFHSIATICKDVVPGWKAIVGDHALTDAIEIKQMVEGLSNQLFRVTLKGSSTPSLLNTVLFRIYGEHVSSFYNPEHELRVFRTLSALGIGPKMVAHGPGWRIEEFHEDSIPLPVSWLQNPSTFTQIASILGRLHKINRSSKFPDSEFVDRTPITLPRLDDWVREGLKALSTLPHHEALYERLRIEQVLPLVESLRSELDGISHSEMVGKDVVFCHNDAQENNILVTPYGLRLIDFEYADFNYQFADLGNIFNEFAIDYLYPEAPLFKGTPADYPSLDARRMFASVYLSEYWGRPVMDDKAESSAAIDQILELAEVGSLISHVLWGFWSLVRAQQQGGESSFDFVEYARYRFDEFIAKATSHNW